MDLERKVESLMDPRENRRIDADVALGHSRSLEVDIRDSFFADRKPRFNGIACWQSGEKPRVLGPNDAVSSERTCWLATGKIGRLDGAAFGRSTSDGRWEVVGA